jgi:carbonic anhydrase
MRSATTSEKRSIARDLFDAEDKLPSFSTYFKVYDSLTTPQYTTVQVYPSALNSHDDIRRLALELRANPHTNREEFKDRVFPQKVVDPETAVDQERAINVAVQLMLMIDCSDKDRHCEDYEVGGFKPVRWGGLGALYRLCEKGFSK